MTKPRTRIQEKNSSAILEAALDVFSVHGYRGATLDQIAEMAGLSKPNLLYYFPSKEAVHTALLNRGSLIAPFHNMMLVSPATKKRQVDRLITAFNDVLTELFS